MREASTNTWLSIGAYARAYGISRTTVYKWLEGRKLEMYRFEGVIRIRNLKPTAHRPIHRLQP